MPTPKLPVGRQRIEQALLQQARIRFESRITLAELRAEPDFASVIDRAATMLNAPKPALPALPAIDRTRLHEYAMRDLQHRIREARQRQDWELVRELERDLAEERENG